MRTITTKALLLMKIDEITDTLKDVLIERKMSCIESKIYSLQQSVANDNGAISLLNKELNNLKHHRSVLNGRSIPTERRSNMVRRVLFGWIEKFRRSS